ncbi:hypothetical protein CXG45_24650 [Pseudomonas plecoglossicida]|uniref:Polypeptide-transport-associated ShlB-type domain-containing protein n=1 Tax=Pseudomonas plecoglossicida TaxID=70775 RepID=A0ABX4TXT4_PSEDL|nr:hypothetical protein CXG44_22505 [Pseudomonas plecoglossicida]PLU90086.1 hypothetical protein CXG45_24650 [Pseudomonas plecoglossicida]PLU97153.1 hypothetical protein CXG48_27800 [Pseudomonas plecoglossicida]PLV08961.1 hypothetical protein CXG47_24920 [Pseudomonas plecoglossicida]
MPSLPRPQRRLEQLKELPGKGAETVGPAKPIDSRCFPINDIVLDGADELSTSERERLLKPYLGQCLGVVHGPRSVGRCCRPSAG